MSVLTRYIMLEVIKGAVVAELVLLSLLTFFTFTDELGDLGQGDYGMLEIGQYLALSLPREFYELMPSAALLGGIVVLGSMANQRELVGMQAAGVSRAQIIKMVLMAGTVLVALSVVIGEYVAPVTERASHMLKTTAMKEEVASQTKYGFWVRDGDVFINIRRVLKQDDLGDISIYELGEGQRLESAVHADRARYANQEWKLEGIRSSRFGREDVSSSRANTMDWVSRLAPDLLNVFVFRPENLSSTELARYVGYLKENGQATLAAEKALWDRIINPIVTLTMLMVALPMVLAVRRETSFGQRIIVGITIGLGFYLANRMFGHFGLIYEMNPIFTASFPAGLVLMVTALRLAWAR